MADLIESNQAQDALIPGLTESRIVHYVLESGRCQGEHRPAIVVRDWKQPNGLVNIQVFTDGWNDDFREAHHVNTGEQSTVVTIVQNTIWRTSVHQDEETKAPGTWHWPERA